MSIWWGPNVTPPVTLPFESGRGWVNVTDSAYGAVGDGLTDDTAAINAATAALVPGDTLFYPQGTYKVTARLNPITTSCTVFGYGAKLVAGTAGMGAGSLAWFPISAAQVTVLGLEFDNTLGQSIMDLNAPGVRITIRDCYFHGYRYDAVTYYASDGAIRPNGATGIKVINCIFDGITSGAPLALVGGVRGNNVAGDDITVQNCTFKNGQQGVIVSAGHKNLIADNTFTAMTGNSIYSLGGVEGVTISGNVFSENLLEVISLSATTGQTHMNASITGNNFRNNADTCIRMGGYPAGSGNIYGVTISGNTFDNQDNTIGLSAIACRASCTSTHYETTITGNTFRGYAGTPVIYGQSMFDGLIIADNRMKLSHSVNGSQIIRFDLIKNALIHDNTIEEVGAATGVFGINVPAGATSNADAATVAMHDNKPINCSYSYSTPYVQNQPRGAVDVTYAASVLLDARLGDFFRMTLTGNVTLGVQAPTDGQVMTVALKQDGTGSRLLTSAASISWAGNVTPTLTTTANRTDFFTLRYSAVDTKWREINRSLNVA